MSDLISVIITVYNVEDYIKECLDSVIKQEYTNLEIIVIDDGSTDGSSMICDKYAEIDSRIKVIHKENAGIVQARKTGVNAALGKYVGYVDADDWIEPQMYSRLYEAIQDSGADVVASGRIEEYSKRFRVCKNKIKHGIYKGESLRGFYSQMIFSGIFFEFGLYPTVWDKLFKKEILLRNQLQVPDDIVIGEDVAVVYPCLVEADTICVLEECFYHYRRREGSMLGTKDNRYNERVYILQQYLFDRFRNTEYWDVLERQIKIYIMDMALNGVRIMYGLESAPEICHQFLFPFQKVKKNSRIALYGAGNVGKKYFRQLEHSGYCQVVCWVDRNKEKFESTLYNVFEPDRLLNIEFDFVIICVADEELARAIENDLIKKGIAENKIVWSDPVY